MNKIAFKGDGTLERGKRIIAELERLGGKLGFIFKNNTHFIEKSNQYGNQYYFIVDDDNHMESSSELPEGYTLTELPEEKEDYTPKTNEELIEQICHSGDCFDEFHTRDINSLLEENIHLKKENEELRECIRLHEDSLNHILNAAQPYNYSECESWIHSARKIASDSIEQAKQLINNKP